MHLHYISFSEMRFITLTALLLAELFDIPRLATFQRQVSQPMQVVRVSKSPINIFDNIDFAVHYIYHSLHKCRN